MQIKQLPSSIFQFIGGGGAGDKSGGPAELERVAARWPVNIQNIADQI